MTETKHEIIQRKIRNGLRKEKERSQAKLWAKLNKTKSGFSEGDDFIINDDFDDSGDWRV